MRDSGERREFSSGAVRDAARGKPRYSLIPPGPLRRLAQQYTKGADKYDDHNWAKGMPVSVLLDSAFRHLEDWRSGDRAEDHLAAVIFNVMGIMHFEGSEWDDFYEWTRDETP